MDLQGWSGGNGKKGGSRKGKGIKGREGKGRRGDKKVGKRNVEDEKKKRSNIAFSKLKSWLRHCSYRVLASAHYGLWTYNEYGR